jgi:hypothetical protein
MLASFSSAASADRRDVRDVERSKMGAREVVAAGIGLYNLRRRAAVQRRAAREITF